MIQPGLRIGRYEVGSRLGTGGFGVVYLARDVELGRELAIKVLRPEYQVQPDVVGRFLQEARAAAKIDHPGIITVFDCGHIAGTGTGADGNAYIAMELLRGHSLGQHLEQRGRLQIPDALLIARQIAVALAVAHAAGIVHRDLKPDNVFLLPDPLVRGGHRIKILDFGVAKLAEPKDVGVNTHSQMMLGTPKYMSPEQARSAATVDHRTDIYTLGCMLFELVTGQAPYDGPGAVDLIIQHTTAPVPSPAARVPGLPRALDELIRTMIAKEPDARPDSMLAIDGALAAIEELAASAIPPTAPRPTLPPPALAPPVRPSQPVFAPPAGFASEPDVPTVARPPVTRRDPRVVFAVTGIAAAGLAAAILWVVLRRPPAASEAAPPPAGDASLATAPSASDARALRAACQQLVEAMRWDDLAACSTRLAAVDADAAHQLEIKARDEKINEQQLRRLDDELRKGDFDAANTLVKRIPDESVYKAEARRRYDDARRARAP